MRLVVTIVTLTVIGFFAIMGQRDPEQTVGLQMRLMAMLAGATAGDGPQLSMKPVDRRAFGSGAGFHGWPVAEAKFTKARE